MARIVYVYRNDKWVEQGGPEDTGFDPSGSYQHNVIQDSMPPTWHPATGEIIDSKSKFRQRTKESGCVEFGNDIPKPRERYNKSGLKEAIIRSYEECQKR